MTNVVVDTHRLFRHLVEHGFTEEQANGLTRAVAEVDLSQLVTKRDLDTGLRELELRMTIKLGGLLAAGVAVLAAMQFFVR